jgi:hypothetical protein
MVGLADSAHPTGGAGNHTARLRGLLCHSLDGGYVGDEGQAGAMVGLPQEGLDPPCERVGMGWGLC